MEDVINGMTSKQDPSRDNSVPSLSPSFYRLAELEFSKGCSHPFAGFPKQILATSNFAIRNQKLQKESAVLRLARVVAVISKPDSSEHEAFVVMLTLEEAQSLRFGILRNPDKFANIQLVSPGGSHLVGFRQSNGTTKLIDILKMTRAIRAPCVTSPASPLVNVYSLFQFVRLFNSDFYYTLADARFLLKKLQSFDGLRNLVDYTLKCRPRWSS
jgi:hypothetical protein